MKKQKAHTYTRTISFDAVTPLVIVDKVAHEGRTYWEASSDKTGFRWRFVNKETADHVADMINRGIFIDILESMGVIPSNA